MKKCILVVSLFLLALPSMSAAEWDSKTTARELYFLGVLANDWRQTCDVATKQGHYEKNHILGKKPSIPSVNMYFAGCAAGHALITWLLPEPYRDAWQLFWIGAQSVQVQRNDDSGLKQNINFSYRFEHTIKF